MAPVKPPQLTVEAVEDRWPETRLLGKLWLAARQWAIRRRRSRRPPPPAAPPPPTQKPASGDR